MNAESTAEEMECVETLLMLAKCPVIADSSDAIVATNEKTSTTHLESEIANLKISDEREDDKMCFEDLDIASLKIDDVVDSEMSSSSADVLSIPSGDVESSLEFLGQEGGFGHWER